MATQSFDNAIKVTRNSAKSFNTILNSTKRTAISKTPVAKDIDAACLRKFFGKKK